MEHASAVGSHAAGNEHVGQLADGRIGHHPLDVGLRERDGGGKERCDRAYYRNDRQRRGRQGKQGIATRQHKHARRHHGSRVDKRAHRGGAFHGVRQPHMQRKLGRLAHRAAEQQQADKRWRADRIAAQGKGHALKHSSLGQHIRIMQAAKNGEDAEQPEQEAKVAKPVDDKGLFARVRSGILFIIKADEQVGRKPHSLPAKKEL